METKTKEKIGTVKLMKPLEYLLLIGITTILEEKCDGCIDFLIAHVRRECDLDNYDMRYTKRKIKKILATANLRNEKSVEIIKKLKEIFNDDTTI